jgi:hypothetical protein
MIYAVEMGSAAMIHIPSFIKTGSGIQKLMGGRIQRQPGNRVSLLKERRIKKRGPFLRTYEVPRSITCWEGGYPNDFRHFLPSSETCRRCNLRDTTFFHSTTQMLFLFLTLRYAHRQFTIQQRHSVLQRSDVYAYCLSIPYSLSPSTQPDIYCATVFHSIELLNSSMQQMYMT